MIEFVIKKNDAGQRLDRFLIKSLNLTIGVIMKAIRNKDVKIIKARDCSVGDLTPTEHRPPLRGGGLDPRPPLSAANANIGSSDVCKTSDKGSDNGE
jgi:hypothetical protein